MRILLISDPHFDFDPVGVQAAVLGSVHRQDYDVIACAGDIANRERDCAEFLSWFSDVKVPKYLVPGNHDLWWSRRPSTSNASPFADGFNGHAARNGWRTPPIDRPWGVVNGVLLFNIFYTPNATWDRFPRIAYHHGSGGNDLAYTQDHRNVFRFEELIADPTPAVGPAVFLSMSHMSPSDEIRSAYAPQVCYVNNRIFEVARQHNSPLHLFGHTHEAVDQVVQGIRCVNRPWMNDEYRINVLDAGAIIHA
jgi:3',5'-cyclic AMP phosphodiesterase CpdA